MIIFISNTLYHVNSWAQLDPSLIMRGELGLGVWLDFGDYSVRPGDAIKRNLWHWDTSLSEPCKDLRVNSTGERKQAQSRGQDLKRFLRLLKTVLNQLNEINIHSNHLIIRTRDIIVRIHIICRLLPDVTHTLILMSIPFCTYLISNSDAVISIKRDVHRCQCIIYINNITTQSHCQTHIQPVHATLDYIHAHRVCMLWIKPPRYVRMHTISSCTISASKPYPHARRIHMHTLRAHAHIHMHPHTCQRAAQRVALMIVSSTLNATSSINIYEWKKNEFWACTRTRALHLKSKWLIMMPISRDMG